MKLDKGTVIAARMLIGDRGLKLISEESGIPPATLSDIRHNRMNVSRKKENQFRKWLGLPLLPAMCQVLVPPGKAVKIVDLNKEPRKPRDRSGEAKRCYPPRDPVAMGKYLGPRMTGEEIDTLIETLLNTYGDTHGHRNISG